MVSTSVPFDDSRPRLLLRYLSKPSPILILLVAAVAAYLFDRGGSFAIAKFEQVPRAVEIESAGQAVDKILHVQGGRIAEYKNANPDDVFEVHPVTKVESTDTRRSFKPIRGFERELRKPDRTANAFHEYNNKSLEITRGKDRTTLVTRYDYVEFIMALTRKPAGLDDEGTAVVADVFDPENPDDEPSAEDLCMVFVHGTKPQRIVKLLDNGARLTVLGIPRISHALVHDWTEDTRINNKDVIKDSLPYEVIVVAVVDVIWPRTRPTSSIALSRYHSRRHKSPCRLRTSRMYFERIPTFDPTTLSPLRRASVM